MTDFIYKGSTYEIDEQGCLLDPDSWDLNFAEGMARECGIPVLSSEHIDVINHIRKVYLETGICPTIFAVCKEIGLRPQEMQKLFPSGYHRGVCLIAGVHYRITNIPYGSHIKESIKDKRMLAEDKIYSTDVRGFLVNPESWDENFAVHRALEMKHFSGKLSDEHWRIIHYLRDIFKKENRIPNIFETCENCNIDLDSFELLFPDGYHRGALKISGLRFIK